MSHDDLRGHLAYFDELGVTGVRLDEAWRTRRAAPAPAVRLDTADPPLAPAASVASHEDPVASESTDAAPAIESHTPVMTPPSRSGREAATPNASPRPATTAPAAAASSAATPADQAGRLRVLQAEIGPDCRRCKLHTLGRTQVVFGVGNPSADLMFVGEAPGADEDQQGEPFVGRAGQLLTKIIEAIGMTRQDVYIANLIKCRPPGNRNPEPDEVEQCEPFLFQQIDTIRPRVIVALGKFSAQALLRTTDPITRIRGREYRYRDAILIPTYHPAYLLRNPSAKRDVWDDMKRVRAILGEPPSSAPDAAARG